MIPGQHYEQQYLDLMRQIWTQGDERVDRTGVGTRAIFGVTMRFDLADDAIPLLTTKRVFWKTAAREMLWFLTGDTNIRELVKQKVHIWTDWPLDKYRKETGEQLDRDAFEQRIIEDDGFAAKWGDLGPVYGKQWVDWPRYTPAGGIIPGPGVIFLRAGMLPNWTRWLCRPVTKPISSMYPTGNCRGCFISAVVTSASASRSMSFRRRC